MLTLSAAALDKGGVWERNWGCKQIEEIKRCATFRGPLQVALKLMIPAFGLFRVISLTAPEWFNDQTVYTVTMPRTILHLGPIGDAMHAKKTLTSSQHHLWKTS